MSKVLFAKLSFLKKVFTMYLSVNKDPGFFEFTVLNQTIVLHDITISLPGNDE